VSYEIVQLDNENLNVARKEPECGYQEIVKGKENGNGETKQRGEVRLMSPRRGFSD